MDSNAGRRPVDESLHRELPQLSVRIAPLRDPGSSRNLSVPSLLEPDSREKPEPKDVSKSTASGIAPTISTAGLPTENESVATTPTKLPEASADTQSSAELPPRPILPAFVNLRALERFPFSSSFDDDALHGPRKRRRVDLQAESFGEHLQLPIPQAQKEQRPPPFGPFAILNGLNEPPPNAALLPPIEAGSISHLLTKPSRRVAGETEPTSGGSELNTTPDDQPNQPTEAKDAKLKEILEAKIDGHDPDDSHIPRVTEPAKRDQNKTAAPATIKPNEKIEEEKATRQSSTGNEPLSPKSRGRSRKNVRKWTEEETTDLLRGVVKCGIGNWTAVLAQPELKFNKRTASNLKDRFRVCCPWAYRASDPNEATKQLRDNLASTLLKAHAEASDDSSKKTRPPIPSLASTSSESSFASNSSGVSSHKPSLSSLSSATTETEAGAASTGQQSSPPETPTFKLSPKSEKTLESLGIPDAHVSTKSKRRSRRPFTTAEDEALLKGYAVHGFHWTLIQQDKLLNLGHRKATDLRDRFRTKFPHVYRDGGSVSGKPLTPNPDPPIGNIGTVPRNEPPSQESTPTKAAAQRRSDTQSHSRQSSGLFDPSFLPPPQGILEPSNNSLSFGLEGSAAAGPSSPWEDNTLAPMVWDDLG
ncbi:hypothetical protein N7468_009288 [Penicillium chermesinum]|uniref:MYB transcription factor n=1 Tax=Penicillium chermesinum TaxID=63820 RepID=A0A9W9TF39_9EURO|nr:uncharacterized protein N7468_009288 [Penicillium chermesinum]KAJ5220084.1 hypothetical protein N7468_009288 [Penicillium chermesinum]KAJ6157533.1 hypothetical protein N7470_005125 [Penicillium chermesinum]